MGEIKEDQKAKLSFKLADDSEKELECFIKAVEKDRLSLKIPHEAYSYAQYLQEGEEIPVKIFTPNGIRMFDAVILNSPEEPEFVIEYVEDNTQIQRREYLRSVLKTKFIVERQDNENILTHTIDIGGGGIKFFYEGTFNKDEVVHCRLYLPFKMNSLQAQGIIIRQPHLPSNHHVFLFQKIDRFDRDKIIQKCFELQAESYLKNEF